jgi:hypothetical protein
VKADDIMKVEVDQKEDSVQIHKDNLDIKAASVSKAEQAASDNGMPQNQIQAPVIQEGSPSINAEAP